MRKQRIAFSRVRSAASTVVMPTISMRAKDKDYAISFAIPSDA